MRKRNHDILQSKKDIFRYCKCLKSESIKLYQKLGKQYEQEDHFENGYSISWIFGEHISDRVGLKYQDKVQNNFSHILDIMINTIDIVFGIERYEQS